ncbi:MAG: 16S rRNA (guanine(527)-N(7))-methyltransferase RsmG [Christensenellales bacterium]
MKAVLDDVFGKDFFSTGEKERFCDYYDLLKSWNEKFNLTAIVDEKGVAVKHFFDSLTAMKYLPENSKVLDVGSGAGFPALPLAIMRKDCDFTLMEATGKKVAFLREVKDKLRLENVNPVHARAEESASLRESFDVVTARAVAELPTLLEYCLPYVKVGGIFIAYKANAEEEIKAATNALDVLGGRIANLFETELPMDGGRRTLIVVSKLHSSPPKYPRGQGKPRSKPL